MRGFRTAAGIVAVVIMLLSMVSATSAAAAAQDETDASAGERIFAADGVDASILRQADIPELDPSATLLLELIELAPDAELAPQTTTSPELFHVLSGVVVFEDNFGFASVVEAGNDVSLNPGTDYTIVNQQREPGRVLRLRLPAAAERGGPAATPVAAASEVSVLVQVSLQNLQAESPRVYLARVQFGAGSDTGDQGHDGPIGLYVDSGTLSVVSPSGLVGDIEAGRAVSLPAEAPLHASTGETEAVAFIAGITGAEGEPFERIRTENDVTEHGAMLEDGATWRSGTAELTVTSHPYSHVMGFDLNYANTGDAETTLALDGSNVTVVDDAGREWHFLRSDCPDEIVAPQSVVECSAHFNPGSRMTRGPVQLTIHLAQFGEIQDATWQMEIDW